jgi:hypothetical protein
MGDLMFLLILGGGIWLAIAIGKSANRRGGRAGLVAPVGDMAGHCSRGWEAATLT